MKKENQQSTEFCPVCGREAPEFTVEDPVNHECLGCEYCLTIKRFGVIQL